jgi:hypothetical protein
MVQTLINPFAGGNPTNIAMETDLGIMCQPSGRVNPEKLRCCSNWFNFGKPVRLSASV